MSSLCPHPVTAPVLTIVWPRRRTVAHQCPNCNALNALLYTGQIFLVKTTEASFGPFSLFTVPASQHAKLKSGVAPGLTGAVLQPYTITLLKTLQPLIASLPPGIAVP